MHLLDAQMLHLKLKRQEPRQATVVPYHPLLLQAADIHTVAKDTEPPEKIKKILRNPPANTNNSCIITRTIS